MEGSNTETSIERSGFNSPLFIFNKYCRGDLTKWMENNLLEIL